MSRPIVLELWLVSAPGYNLRTNWRRGDRPPFGTAFSRQLDALGAVEIRPLFADDLLTPKERVALALPPQPLLGERPRSFDPLAVPPSAAPPLGQFSADLSAFDQHHRPNNPTFYPYITVRIEVDRDEVSDALRTGSSWLGERLADLRRLPEIAQADEAPRLRTDAIRMRWSRRAVKLRRAQRMMADVPRKVGAVVGLVDTGVYCKHPALKGSIDLTHSDHFIREQPVSRYVLDSSGQVTEQRILDAHGTMVAGIIAGSGTPWGDIGVAPSATIISRVQGGSALQGPRARRWYGASDWVAAIKRCVDLGAEVINCSWHLEMSPCERDRDVDVTHRFGILGLLESPLKEVILHANQAGVAVVCSAGNRAYFGDLAPYPSFPAVLHGQSYKAPAPLEVISVGAVVPVMTKRRELTRHIDSNFGEGWLSLMAPGYHVCTTTLPRQGGHGSGLYDFFGGTSAAAPHVTGAIALMIALARIRTLTLPPSQLRAILEVTARKKVLVDYVGRKVEYGAGVLNIPAALEEVLRA